jgi:hypothetical protein
MALTVHWLLKICSDTRLKALIIGRIFDNITYQQVAEAIYVGGIVDE